MIAKELRALAPTWLAIVVAMVGAEHIFWSTRGLSAPVYFIGAVALGAQAIGHEFSHRTLAMLLTQPVSRNRILLVKVGVLALLLAALAGTAAVTLPFRRVDQPFIAGMLALPCALGLFVAPWLSMTARSALAGTVFPVALAGITLLTGNWLGVRLHGYTREVDTFTVAFMWWTMGGLCALGAVMTWWTFHRLQITDGMGLEIRARAGATRPATASFTRRNAVWLLLMKELHLQQLAFVVALVYVASYFLVVLAFDSAATTRGDSVTAGTVLYAGILAMLIGALASAEERQLGTHEWQQLLPMAAWQQWAVKAGTAIGLAFVLGIGLPILLVSVLPPEHVTWPRRIWPMRQPVTVILLAAVTTGSLYVSSVTRSGLWALTVSVPVAFGVAMFFASVGGPIERAVHDGGLLSTVRLSLPALAGNAVFLAVFAALLGMVLWFALANHRSAERSVSRIAQQVGWMAATAVVGLTAVLVLGAI
jgi:ABC-type transport system involved in multi-copper enzyme maturation permease subunit